MKAMRDACNGAPTYDWECDWRRMARGGIERAQSGGAIESALADLMARRFPKAP